MKNFGKPTRGFICLQDHGNEVTLRVSPVTASVSATQLSMTCAIHRPSLPHVKAELTGHGLCVSC